jgi:succinate dehydrogenase / fumarate reductase, membrane anchor subunit
MGDWLWSAVMSGKGTSHFKQQRLTAMANVPLVLFLLWFVLTHLGATRAEMVASAGHPLIALLLAAAMVSMLWHMWLGMQMILEDYVHDAGLFRLSMMFTTLFVTVLGVVSLYAIAKMSFGF